MGEQLFEIGRRTFDTPHFRGIEFIEVEAKTILNKVPGNYLPFNWTINPYRGCTHACSYCQGGDTPILMSDGTERRLADLRIGDQVIGIDESDGYRPVVTEVMAHWSTRRVAMRTELSDGTSLLSSSDHRFLTSNGWKHVLSDHRSLSIGDVLVTLEGTVPERAELVAETKVESVKDLGFEMPMYDITTGTGNFIADGVISHNCFARVTHTFMDLDAGRDFETKIYVKVNAPEVLRKQLRRKSWKGESVAMGTGTDPYQRAEGRYKLMPRLLDALIEVRNPFSILTKGTLILRDIDLLAEAAELMDVSTAFSIGTLDEDVWRRSEPGTPHPRKRVEAVKRLNEAGIPCGVLIAPVLPGISDGEDQLRAVVEACLDAGATHVSPILLHLRPTVREVYMEWLAAEYPDLVPRYEEMYPKAYASKGDRGALSARVAAMAASHPRKQLPYRPRRWRDKREVPRAPKSEQLSLI